MRAVHAGNLAGRTSLPTLSQKPVVTGTLTSPRPSAGTALATLFPIAPSDRSPKEGQGTVQATLPARARAGRRLGRGFLKVPGHRSNGDVSSNVHVTVLTFRTWEERPLWLPRC